MRFSEEKNQILSNQIESINQSYEKEKEINIKLSQDSKVNEEFKQLKGDYEVICFFEIHLLFSFGIFYLLFIFFTFWVYS